MVFSKSKSGCFSHLKINVFILSVLPSKLARCCFSRYDTWCANRSPTLVILGQEWRRLQVHWHGWVGSSTDRWHAAKTLSASLDLTHAVSEECARDAQKETSVLAAWLDTASVLPRNKFALAIILLNSPYRSLTCNDNSPGPIPSNIHPCSPFSRGITHAFPSSLPRDCFLSCLFPCQNCIHICCLTSYHLHVSLS